MQKSRVSEKVNTNISTNYTEQHDNGADVAMRQFIRHPSDIPINVDVVEASQHLNHSSLVNVSRGGLCFQSDVPMPIGSSVHLAIPIDNPPFEINGQVAWCRMEEDHFSIGLAFDDSTAAYSVRMVEQVCYIEHYRTSIALCEGRSLSSEEAAAEWIDKYAAEFCH